RLSRLFVRLAAAVAAIRIFRVLYTARVLAPVVAPYHFDDADLHNTFASPSGDHLLGTVRLGRDVLSRLVWSAQTTVIISALTVIGGSLILGVSLGLTTGYFAGRVDS